MAIVTLTEAAALAGVSRGTLYNRIKDGVLSKSGEGIDTADLLRVFGPLSGSVPEAAVASADAGVERGSDVSEQPLTGDAERLNTLLMEQLEAAERDRAWLRELVEVERARVAEKDAALAERDARLHVLTERVAALLPAPSAPEIPPLRRGFWRRVFGA